MTKAEIVANISEKLGIEKVDVQLTVESLMKEIIDSLENGENVYLRGFGSFIVKKRAEKTARNIKKNTTIKIPAHNIPAFKPSKFFIDGVFLKLTPILARIGGGSLTHNSETIPIVNTRIICSNSELMNSTENAPWS